ncbi:MAG: hypothetical protein KDD66_13450 [Bdellovibrionales bacterium]|nr:hypothetical protein [Bdellovibrionales bacterium]
MQPSDSPFVTIVLGLDKSREAAKSLLGRLYENFDPNAIWDYLLQTLNPRGDRTASELQSITLGAPNCEIAATGGTFALDWTEGDVVEGVFRGVLTIDTDGEHFRFTNGKTGEKLTFFRAKAPGARVAKAYVAFTTTRDRVTARLPRLRQARGTYFASGTGSITEMSGAQIVNAICGEVDDGEQLGDGMQARETDGELVGSGSASA